MHQPGLWDNPEKAAAVVAELKGLKALVDPVQQAHERAEELAVLHGLAESENDPETLKEVDTGLMEGDMVVTKGNFKIDSALQIQAKPSMMNPTGQMNQPMPPGHHH